MSRRPTAADVALSYPLHPGESVLVVIVVTKLYADDPVEQAIMDKTHNAGVMSPDIEFVTRRQEEDVPVPFMSLEDVRDERLANAVRFSQALRGAEVGMTRWLQSARETIEDLSEVTAVAKPPERAQ